VQFVVVGRDEIECGVIVREPYAVISISDPGTRRPRIHKPTLLRAALFLKFHDAEDQMHPDIVLMKLAHAKRIWRFVREHRDKIGILIVQCEQGASRSPAVAAAICRTLGGDDSGFFNEFVPNPYVYALLLKTVPPELREG
jgi:predicted protein tyrosine phosphatase